MYQHGVRCVDCHNPHTGKTILPGNLLCLRCHNGSYKGAPVINPVTHSHHLVFGFNTNDTMHSFDLSTYQPDKIKETGGECINCHMPQTVYMQCHWRHDHGFTIPDPLLTKQFNIPNACNRCHQDKDADWSLKYVEQWYGEKMNRPTRTRAQIIARARNGDDSARDGLLKILQTDPQGYWRAVAAKLLAHWVGETPVNNALVNQLADTNALVRQSIVQTLATLGDAVSPEIHAALNKSLDDASRNVCIVAALALAPELDLQSPAGRDLLQMLAQNADQPAGQMQLGGFDFTRGDVTNALQHFQRTERWDAHSPGIRNQLAVVYDRIGQPDEAVKELQTAIKLAPDEAEYHFKLALAWNELGQSAKTLVELETAVKLDPHFARAQYNLGLALNAAGNPAGAIQALLAAEAADPRDPRIPYARATIYAQLGQWDAARQAAQRALNLNPQFTAAAALLQQLKTK
jgi:Flp pilus assembly protein TadD